MTDQEETISEEINSSKPSQKDDSDNKSKDAYFILIIPSEEKINFKGLNYETQNKIEPSIIFNKTIDKEDKTYIEEIVFKFKKRSKKKKKEHLNLLTILLNL